MICPERTSQTTIEPAVMSAGSQQAIIKVTGEAGPDQLKFAHFCTFKEAQEKLCPLRRPIMAGH